MIEDIVAPFTMASRERVTVMIERVRNVIQFDVPGAIVECGVWRGGNVMAAALALLERSTLRDLYLFDTFAGMTPPELVDVDFAGNTGASQMAEHPMVRAYCSRPLVERNLRRTGYPRNRLHYIEGDVMDTVPQRAPKQIALLRLDVDWYRITKHCLTHLWPRLESGGTLLIDDYGWWQGCRIAVDEVLGEQPWNHIDDIGVWITKP